MNFLRSASISVCLWSAVSRSFAAADDSSLLHHPWVMACAQSGLTTPHVPLPQKGTIFDLLLSCLVETSVTDGFSDAELSLRSAEPDWCFPPLFLSTSSTCQAEGFQPHNFLFSCLSLNGLPTIDKFTFYYDLPLNDDGKSTFSGPYANDTIIVINPLIDGMCSLLDAIRTPPGLLCLIDVCRTVNETQSNVPSERPSMIPSDRPSVIPSDRPSVIPSDQPSLVPSDRASKIPSDQPSVFPSDQPSKIPSDEPSMIPSTMPSIKSSLAPTEIPTIAQSPGRSFVPTEVGSAELSQEPNNRPISLEKLPSLAVQVEILMRFVVQGVAAIKSPPSSSFLETLKAALNQTLVGEEKGHKAVDVVSVINTTRTTAEIVVLAVARRESSSSSASSVSAEIVSDYLDALRNANAPGGLTQQVEFQAYLRGVEALLRITIDTDSVRTVTDSNSEDELSGVELTGVEAPEGSSGVALKALCAWVETIVISVVISNAIMN